MKISIAQVNPTIGDLVGNYKIVCDAILKGIADDSDVVLLPELVTTGYPPKDLLYNDEIWESNDRFIKKVQHFLSQQNNFITVILGGLHRVKTTYGRKEDYNAAYVIDKKEIRIVHKRLLPSYNVFNENRYFVPGNNEYYPIPIKTSSGVENCDVLICEDIWNFNLSGDSKWMPEKYKHDPLSNLKGDGPIFVLNASPFWVGKPKKMFDMLCSISRSLDRNIYWCNQVGAHDDLVFGGYSCAVNRGSFYNLNYFAEDFETINNYSFNTIDRSRKLKFQMDIFTSPELVTHQNGLKSELDAEEFDTYTMAHALGLALNSYFHKNKFSRAVFGSSSGIDSALVGAIASIWLGSKLCTGITMPSKFSSGHSITDSQLLANNTGTHFIQYDIKDLHEAFRSKLLSVGKPEFENPITDENLQPRIRMMLLMAYCNEHNALLISTGNKSELSMGYCTIYGDLSGGYSLISDVWKTDVYKLARFINKYYNNIIPIGCIENAPSAELKANQKDTDSLPDYSILDPILKDIILDVPYSELAEKYHKKCDIYKIYNTYNNSEFKRKQAPIGPKINLRSFDCGRNMPLCKRISYV